MRNLLFSLVALATLSASPPADAQQLHVKVDERYGLTAADQGKRIQDRFAAGQDTTFAGFPFAWARWRAMGMPYATFRKTFLGCAAAMDIAWLYEAPNNIATGFQNSYSFADWSETFGHWQMNRTVPLPRAGMEGASSFGYWDEGNTTLEFATTEWEMNEADWWPANQTERRVFESPNSGLDGYNNYSYNESFSVTNMRVTGPAIYGDGITRIGMYLRRSGECSKIDQLNFAMFQYGLVINGGVPLKGGTITVFWNEKAGVAMMGTWGATIQIDIISGDSNGILAAIIPGYGDEAGGRIDINLLKDEDGILAEAPNAPYRGQVALWAEGQYALSVDVINCSRNWIRTDAMVVIDPRLKSGAPQGSVLKVGVAIGFNYRTVVHNLATGQRIESPGDYQAWTLTHYARDNRYVFNDLPTTPTACACPALGFFRGSDAPFNYTACTPVRGGTTNTTPTATWNCPTWGACVNGTQTRTCTCTGTGCPTPATRSESQSCTITPPSVGNLGRSLWTVTAFATDGANVAARMIDASLSTFWMSNASMANGQIVTVDLGEVRTVSGITFGVLPGYDNSYPRTFDVQVSTTAAFPSNPITPAKAVPGGRTSAASWAEVPARFVRIVCRTGNSNWWNINDLNIKGR